MAIQRTFDTFLTLSEINGRLFIINIPRPFWTVSIVAPVCGGFFPFLVFCSFLCPFHHYFFLLLPPVQINCSSKTPPAGWTTSLCSFQPFFSSHPSIPASHPSSIIVFCCPSLIVQNLYVKLCKPSFFSPLFCSSFSFLCAFIAVALIKSEALVDVVDFLYGYYMRCYWHSERWKPAFVPQVFNKADVFSCGERS